MTVCAHEIVGYAALTTFILTRSFTRVALPHEVCIPHMKTDVSSLAGGSARLIAPELLKALDLVPTFDLSGQNLPLVRAAIGGKERKNALPLSPEQQAVRCEERFVRGAPGAPDVRVLIYTPAAETSAPHPALLHLHGGGYILGVPEINDGSNRQLVVELNCTILSVDYRLAPETRYPGALEDCYAALKWLYDSSEHLGVDRNCIAICGESAGAGHAAALALLARKRNEVPVCLQVLDSPMLDDRTGSTSDPHPYCGEFTWSPASNRFGWQSLLGVEPGGLFVPVDAVPARATDLTGLPPTFIAVGALDLFLEESLEFARRLIRAGVSTELHVIPGAFHAFAAAGNEAPQVKAFLRWRRDALVRAFKRGAQ